MTNQNGSSHKAANKPFNPLKILAFIINKAKAVKLCPILSTSWAGTVEVLAAKRKDRILTLQRQHLINSGDSNTQNQKGGYWKAGCFYRTLNRILAISRRNKIHFPLLPSTLCQTLVFTPAFKPSPTKSSLDQGTIRQVTGLFEVWDRVASNYAQLCIICVITQTMRNSA